MKFLIVFVAVVAAAAGLPTGISEASAPLVQLIVNVNAGQQVKTFSILYIQKNNIGA